MRGGEVGSVQGWRKEMMVLLSQRWSGLVLGVKILLVGRGTSGGSVMEWTVGGDLRCTSIETSSHAKRLDAVQEIGPRVVDGHGRVVRILCPTLGGLGAQVMPHLLALVQVHPD